MDAVYAAGVLAVLFVVVHFATRQRPTFASTSRAARSSPNRERYA
jgi:hypothetical protein